MLRNVYEQEEEIDDDFEFNCSFCEKIKIWFLEWKASEINSITLSIRDPILRSKFAKVELLAVKRRWEIATIVFTVLAIITLLLNWGAKDQGKAIELIFNIGDVWVLMILFSIFGRIWPPVHNYSVFVLIIVRAAWIII